MELTNIIDTKPKLLVKLLSNMVKTDLAFYIKQKLTHRFLQHNFLNTTQFSKFVHDNRIQIAERTLEDYEREKWMQPAFRLVNIEEASVGTYYRPEDLKKLYDGGFVEFPEYGDYEPWSNFESDRESGKWMPKKWMYYHRFQILQVINILRHKQFRFTHLDSYGQSFLDTVMNNIQRQNSSSEADIASSQFGKIENIGLLMLLEEPYRSQAFGKMDPPTNINDNFSDWIEWKREFSASNLLQNSEFSIEQIRALRDHFVTQVRILDPLSLWYDLLRIMKISSLNMLKGEALTAQLYYGIIRMMSLFLHDLTGENIVEPDILSGSTDGEWKRKAYSDPLDYGSRKTHRAIIARFIRNPTTRLYLIVEGDTEEIIINRIFEKWNIDVESEGICLINSKGIANMRRVILDPIIETANRDFIVVYMIADNEAKSQTKIRTIRDSMTTKFDFHIWRTSFEEDNFGFEKVVDLVNSSLHPQGKSVTYSDVRNEQKLGRALVRSIKSAYSNKYHDDLCKNIPEKKPDISVKLFESRLAELSLDPQSGTPTEIEKVLLKVLALIPNWS